jgi:hypothetical protein
LSRPIIVRTRGESHQWDGIIDPKRLQLPFATKSAQSGHWTECEISGAMKLWQRFIPA